jgi:hypothetical protein
VASCYENGNEPSGSIEAGNFLIMWSTISISKITLLHGITCSLFGCSSHDILTRDRRLLNVVYTFRILLTEVPTLMPSAWMLSDSWGHWL